MRTILLLMAEYGTAQIPLEKCASLFGLTSGEAAKRAARAALPVPAFRLASQKSPWLVDAGSLADYLDQQKAAAEKEWTRVRSAYMQTPLKRAS
jgi:hypothetical protein